MAISRVCSVDGCSKSAAAKGFCHAHYERWKLHGDPTAGRTPAGSKLKFLDNIAVPCSNNDCLIWPFSRNRNGYGIIKLARKKAVVASRYVCMRVHGEPPTSEHQAAHSCGKGKEGCVNPRHLSWKTPAENQMDKIGHGTIAVGIRNPAAKLTEEQVREIRALAGHLTRAKISEIYGVSIGMISGINTRKYWASITG